ncbi:hypothetical protein GCM10011375_00180 [Hymenobacter qilianensis]|uniref:Uncharacterized protein n=1 Tax=Hymenobacter qilianensis TaxID=1385715 RepID=A0ACB5PKU4_9BACT|nr:hypothetical protein GCM10011375_00180 [Hymenobacter qilianensis]
MVRRLVAQLVAWVQPLVALPLVALPPELAQRLVARALQAVALVQQREREQVAAQRLANY